MHPDIFRILFHLYPHQYHNINYDTNIRNKNLRFWTLHNYTQLYTHEASSRGTPPPGHPPPPLQWLQRMITLLGCWLQALSQNMQGQLWCAECVIAIKVYINNIIRYNVILKFIIKLINRITSKAKPKC